MSAPAPVEELSASLVREFLSRKGLKMTLEKMDNELPRNSESISNRVALARAVHIEKLMKNNKERSSPYRTMIEVIVQFLAGRGSKNSTTKSVEAKDLRRSSDGRLHSSTATATGNSSGGSSEPSDVAEGSLRSQGSVSDGALEWNMTTTRTDRRKLHSKYGNPLTRSVDTTLLGGDSTQLLGSSILEEESEEKRFMPTGEPNRQANTTGVSTTGVSTTGVSTTGVSTTGPTCASTSHEDATSSSSSSWKASSTSRKDTTSLMMTSALGGLRNAKFQNFKPRSPAEFEAVGESSQSVLPLSSNSKREPGKISCQSMRKSSLPGGTETNNEGGRGGGGGGDWDAGGGGVVLKGGERGMRSWHSAGRVGTERNTKWLQGSNDLLCEDLEDLDLSVGSTPSPGLSKAIPVVSSGRPITLEVAKALRELLFGSARGPSFNAEWKKQNFFFCDLPDLEYGLIQHKGGPCGILACVQAHVLKHLLFSDPTKNFTSSPHPSPEERSVALVGAFHDILWRAGKRKQAVVALPSPSAAGLPGYPRSASYKPDHITETLVLHHFTDSNTLHSFLNQQLGVFQNEHSRGCVLFLLSAILSRGIEIVRCDMDEKNSQLIGAHGYCTQEMVNLLLTGAAVSNVHDDNLELDSGGRVTHTLKGIPEQSEVGVLSLFEHYGSCTVGSHYKEPVYPIWVVCSESHFTVLFNHQRKLLQNWQLERKFDLFYYDGLASQDEVIRLTIDNSSSASKAKTQDDLTPPLELCIRTKWKSATVNWNGTEPIL